MNRRKDRRGTPKAKTPPKGVWVVNGYSAEWLQKGFPWVYPKEVVSRGAAADTIELRSADGRVLGRGLPDEGWISARVYRHDDGPLDTEWLRGRLERAAALREVVIDPNTTAYRLVHGENDGLPGLRIDVWGHVLTVVLDSPAVAPLLDGVVSWLNDRFTPRAIYLCYRPDPRDERDFSTVEPAPGLIAGTALSSEVRVTERDVAFRVRPWEGPDVGLYTDMRAVRAWLEPHWGGTRVLNTFAYTGAFSVAAAVGGASEIVTTDLSSAYLERAEANFVANELDPGLYDFIEDDTFKALDRLRRTGRRFDRIILDPPSFSHSREGLWSAKKDYPRLVAAALRVLEPGGWLIAASNHGQTSPRDFRGYITDGARKAGVLAQELTWLGQSADVPAATWFPEGRYLKVGVWRSVAK
ncbi:MAG: class I SAM-dependent rRNA methyltransferase [Myxococcota bacterium]